jgi:hypothetical protein
MAVQPETQHPMSDATGRADAPSQEQGATAIAAPPHYTPVLDDSAIRWPDYFGVPLNPDGSHHVEPLLHHRPPRTWAPVWRRAKLPSPPRAVTGLTRAEIVVFVLLVPLIFAPVFLATRSNPIPIAICAVLTAGMSYLVWARRVVVGNDYLAIRQLGRYHVATIGHVTHWRVRPSQRGGVVVVMTDDERQMRIRHAEVTNPDVNAALHALLARSDSPPLAAIQHLLNVEDSLQTRSRFIADMYQ